ncbi:MAG: tetratricopeptide repeat protein [Thermoleophilaceae bacterium]|nr:tetratricopeptide repeat protein [Thermoleophilaceae bacterium]
MSLAATPEYVDQAEEMLRSICAEGNDDEALSALADILQKQGRWADLEELYRKRVVAGDRRYLERVGYAIGAQDDRDEESKLWYRTAINEGHSVALAYLNLGNVSLRLDQRDEAISCFEDALRLGEERAGLELAQLLQDGPRDDEVDGLFRRATRKGSPSAPAYLARRLWARGETDELEDLYLLALDRGHGPAPAAELACALHMYELDRVDEAGHLVDRALELRITWDVLDAVARQGVIERETGVWMLRRSLETARQLGDEHPCGSDEFHDSVLSGLIDILVNAERYEEAEALAHSVDARTPDGVVKAEVRMFTSQRKWNEAEQVYRERVNAGELHHLPALARLLREEGTRQDDRYEVLKSAVSHGVERIDCLHELAAIDTSRSRDERAVQHLEHAIECGDEKVATVWLARLLKDGPRDGEVDALLLRASNEDYAPAYFDRALRARNDGGPKADQLAIALLKKAASAGLSRAQISRGFETYGTPHGDRAWFYTQLLAGLEGVAGSSPSDPPVGLQYDFGAELADEGERTEDSNTIERARVLLSEAARRGSKQAVVRLGVLAARQGQTEDAKHWFNESAASENPNGLRGLAMVLIREGEPARARAALERAVDLGDGGATLELHDLLLDLDEVSAALELLCDAADRDVTGSHGALGRLLVKLEAPDEDAFRAFRRAVAFGDARAATNLGFLLQERGEMDAAIDVYRQGIEFGGRYCMNNLADVLTERGEFGEAEALYRRAIELGCPEAEEGLQELLSSRGKIDAASADRSSRETPQSG